jgi:outer membrane protein OmpA-like peptidoglycan-associated protein
MFYDTDKFFKSDTANSKAIAKAKNYESLLNIVHDLVNLTDSVGINYVNMLYSGTQDTKQESISKQKKYERLIKLVNKAISETDTAILKHLEENTAFKDKRDASFYYSAYKNDSTYLKTVVVGNDTIKAAQIMEVKRQFKPMNLYEIISEHKKDTSHNTTKLKFISTSYIFYPSSEYKIPDKYYKTLEDLVALMRSNKNLLIELHGYADKQGNNEFNRSLSYKRAFEISRFLKKHNIKGKRIKIFAHGKIEKGNMNKNRKVEIKIFEKTK